MGHTAMYCCARAPGGKAKARAAEPVPEALPEGLASQMLARINQPWGTVAAPGAYERRGRMRNVHTV